MNPSSGNFESWWDVMSSFVPAGDLLWHKILLAEADYRQLMERHDYVTPPLTHSLRFAAGELLEMDDIRLREDGDYKRNSVRNHDAKEEFGDFVSMLATARMVHQRYGHQQMSEAERHYTIQLAGLLESIASALMSSALREPLAPGWDVAAEIDVAAWNALHLAAAMGIDPLDAQRASRDKQEGRWAHAND